MLLACVWSLPRTTWEGDEVRFVDALRTYDPLQQQPEAPGYPLYVAAGRLASFFVHDPFAALVAVSVLSAVAGAAITAAAAGAILGNAWAGAAAAIILYLSPAMMVFGPLPSSESATVALIATAIVAAISGRAVLFGIAVAAAAGVHPEATPALLVLLVAGCVILRSLRPLAAFAVAAAVIFIPLVEAIGVSRVGGYAATNFRALQTASASVGLTTSASIVRFAVHPWGSKFLSFPLLLAAAMGFVLIARRRKESLVLALFAAAQLLFCVAWADRGDGVQPAIPAMIAVAIFAAAALARWPAVAFAAALLYGAASYAYVAPILSARRMGPSPPSAIATYARASLPASAVLLYETSMEAYARHCGVASAALTDANPLAFDAGVPLYILGEGGSRHPESKSFAWPDSDAYGKITTERCRVASIAPWPAEERYRGLSGVHGWQRTAEGEEWRWLARDAVLEVSPRRSSVAVTLALPVDAGIPRNSVSITSGGTTTTVTLQRGERKTALVPLGGSELRLRSEQTFTPADGRELAVQLLAVEQRDVRP